jgi:hypothetical protein
VNQQYHDYSNVALAVEILASSLSMPRLTKVRWVSVLSTLRLYVFGFCAAVFPASVTVAYVADPL